MLRHVLAIAILIGLSAVYVPAAEEGNGHGAAPTAGAGAHASEAGDETGDEPGAADGHADEHAGGHEGESNIFAGNLGTSIITIAIFLVLLFILGRYAWRPILSGLQKREEHIRKSIEDAEKAQADAERALKEYQQKLNQANKEAEAVLEKGRKDAIKLADELKQKAQEEAGNLRQQAQADIEAAKDQALQDIYQQSADLATDLAGRIIGKSLSPDDHRALLQESLSKLQNTKN